jgi:hypothetical protein
MTPTDRQAESQSTQSPHSCWSKTEMRSPTKKVGKPSGNKMDQLVSGIQVGRPQRCIGDKVWLIEWVARLYANDRPCAGRSHVIAEPCTRSSSALLMTL